MNRVICYPKKVGHFECSYTTLFPLLLETTQFFWRLAHYHISPINKTSFSQKLCLLTEFFPKYYCISFFFQFQNDGLGLNIAGGNDWTNIIIPGDANSSEFHHEKNFLLADLVTEAQYECLVQAKNQYGWSEASRIHRFMTTTNAFGKCVSSSYWRLNFCFRTFWNTNFAIFFGIRFDMPNTISIANLNESVQFLLEN